MRFLSCILLFLSACCCKDRAPQPIQNPLEPEPNVQDVTHRFLTYGDTRTGVFLFENQDNAGEAVHDWIAQQMVARLGKDKADIIFGGDAVYAGGATFHWDNFVKAVSRFKAAGLPFYPCTGNHELMAGIFGVLSPWFGSGEEPIKFTAQARSPEEAEWRRFIVDRHQELKKVNHRPEALGQDAISRIDARAKDMEERILSRVEDQVKSISPADRNESGRQVMEAIYVKKAGFTDLERFFSTKTYYSVEYTQAKPTILLMMLDTNSLDHAAQKAWFQQTLKSSRHDLVIVVGHHPPKTIEGWDDDYMAAFQGQKNAAIWIFSHVHAFVYAFPDPPAIPASRALFVSGGGGAPLVESDEQVVPIRGWKFGPPNDLDGRFFHFLDIRTTRDAVYVTVLGCLKKGEPVQVKATYKIGLPTK